MTYDPGLDISSWQATTPDLSKVDFVVVRAGYNSSTVDAKYAYHAANVRKAGKALGAYWFWYDGQDNAKAVATFLKTAADADFYVLDLEGTNAATHGIPQAKDFIAKMHAAGKKCGLYHSLNGYPSCGQDFNWVADWSTTKPNIPWVIWQVGGSPLDRDNFYGTHTQFEAWLASIKGTPTAGGMIGADMPYVTINHFDTPRSASIPKGGKVDGYDPAKPGAAVKSETFADGSSFSVDAQVSVDWPGDSTPPVPHGSGFYRAYNGVFTGLLIPSGQITVAPPVDPTAALKTQIFNLNATVTQQAAVIAGLKTDLAAANAKVASDAQPVADATLLQSFIAMVKRLFNAS